ncbi:hypothetical protein WN944_020901 [Citrus x changshan-huyou]|uniref:Uncharacterized protein n=1 Tax=Citrus x changshan-huyou TaxID=2935761 RepID=A0AAP0QZA6_9ROSI
MCPSCVSKDHHMIRRGFWTGEEDERLKSFILLNGEEGGWNWEDVPRGAGLLRCGKTCHDRWFNHLNPTIRRGDFTLEEDELIINLCRAGSKWTNIGLLLPGRTHKDVMNYCKTSYMRYKMSNRGVDPFANKRPRSKSSTASSSASASKKKNIIQEESTSKIPKNQLDGEKSGKLDLHLSLKTPN